MLSPILARVFATFNILIVFSEVTRRASMNFCVNFSQVPGRTALCSFSDTFGIFLCTKRAEVHVNCFVVLYSLNDARVSLF